MKLLILTPYIPYPINSGGNLLFFQLVDRMRKYADISIILRVRKSQESDVLALKKLWDNVTFHLFRENESKDSEKLSYKYDLMKRWSESFDRKIKRKRNSLDTDFVRQHSVASYNNSDFYKPQDQDYLSFVDSILKQNDFDLVQVDFFEMIDVINIIPRELKKVFIHHELRYVRSKCELKLFQNITATDTYMHNYSKAYELQHLQFYDGIVCLTDVDKQKLIEENLEESKLYVSPAIVDVKTKGLPEDYQFENKLVYLGGSDHFPNYDAVNWFLNTCWNQIHMKNPSLEFHIIGLWKSKVARQYEKSYPGVKFRGFVDDLAQELKDAIMLVPLRIGSGVRMKILEAISLGCPVISSDIGAEGIGLKNKESVLYANTSTEWLEAIEMLAMNDTLCKQIREGAYAKLLERKSPDELAKIRLDIYKSVLEQN